MRILIIGDIVGRPGKHACSQIVPRLIRERGVECVIANAENTAAGSGLTPAMFKKLQHMGIDGFTMGDHIYKRREIVETLNASDRIIKPANYPPEAAGRTWTVFSAHRDERQTPVAIVSLIGRIFINVRADCPFHAADRVLAEIGDQARIVIVDVHAEATSEKIALGWYLDGKVTAVVGTHTHVQTADERILPQGTAYITDLGMTGPHDSVLGRDKNRVMAALKTGMPHPYSVATDDIRLNGVILEVDRETGRALSVERISLQDEPADASTASDAPPEGPSEAPPQP